MATTGHTVEETPVIKTPSPNPVTNPAPTKVLVGIAELSAYTGTKYDKDYLLRFVKPIDGLDTILLSAKQMQKLAASVGVSIDTAQQFQLLKTLVGNHESEVEISVEKLLSGSVYIDKNGIEVIRKDAGVSILPQSIVLPMETRVMLLQSAVKTVSHQWTSASRFATKPATVENAETE